MQAWLTLFRVIHVLSAVLMAWPFYALMAVNQRGRLGPPLGDRADLYLENVIRNRTVPCFVFQGTALVTGFALILLPGLPLSTLWTRPLLGIKLLLLLLIAGLLSYVHLRLQPAIDHLFATAAQNPIPAEVATRIQALRLRRKQVASVCLFSVLTLVILGVVVSVGAPGVLTGVLVLLAGGFAWHAYRTTVPYGWW